MQTPIVSRVQIKAAFDGPQASAYGPVLTTKQVAELTGVPRKTLYEWIAKGRLNGSFRKRGKHHLFWRDKVLDLILNGKDWT